MIFASKLSEMMTIKSHIITATDISMCLYNAFCFHALGTVALCSTRILT